MAFTNVLPGSDVYPDVRLRWAPTTQPTDASQTYTDITDRLRGWEWGYGRNDELGRFEAGNGHVLVDNSDRAFDPSFNAGAWFGNIKPRRMFELVARWNGLEYPVFVGYARGFPQSYPAAGFDNVVKVDLVDAFAILQGFDLVIGFERPAERSGARIEAVLDAIGVPAALRTVATGTVTVDAITVDTAGTSGLDHAKSVALDSEQGQLYVAPDGKVTFEDYSFRTNQSPVATFSDDPADRLRYSLAFEPAYNETYLWNYSRVTGATGDDTAHVAENTASQDDYFTLTKTVSTQLASGSDIQQAADRLVLRYAQPELRVPAMTLLGARSPVEMWQSIFNDLFISNRITVERFSTAADPMALSLTVEGIRHACAPGGPWVTTLTTSPADTRSYFVLNDSTLGQLNAGNLLA